MNNWRQLTNHSSTSDNSLNSPECFCCTLIISVFHRLYLPENFIGNSTHLLRLDNSNRVSRIYKSRICKRRGILLVISLNHFLSNQITNHLMIFCPTNQKQVQLVIVLCLHMKVNKASLTRTLVWVRAVMMPMHGEIFTF